MSSRAPPSGDRSSFGCVDQLQYEHRDFVFLRLPPFFQKLAHQAHEAFDAAVGDIARANFASLLRELVDCLRHLALSPIRIGADAGSLAARRACEKGAPSGPI